MGERVPFQIEQVAQSVVDARTTVISESGGGELRVTARAARRHAREYGSWLNEIDKKRDECTERKMARIKKGRYTQAQRKRKRERAKEKEKENQLSVIIFLVKASQQHTWLRIESWNWSREVSRPHRSGGRYTSGRVSARTQLPSP